MSKNLTLLDKVWRIKAQYAENQPVSMVVGGIEILNYILPKMFNFFAKYELKL